MPLHGILNPVFVAFPDGIAATCAVAAKEKKGNVMPIISLNCRIAMMQEQPKNLVKLAKHFRHSISLLKNGVSTCYGLTGKAALAKYNASTAALVNSLDKELELAVRAEVTLEQAYDLYEAELRQNR